ncbi:hypothetical protein KJ980_04210 [Patescibacteria group bacterium]|nr:hypothetical protein [Patescibacteria group bacterium]MBU4016590.1 hypothetical protein [Patescibacteria group bacterium]MBU4098827.1 hypothetical protein [Patescibacteria group bacterium]
MKELTKQEIERQDFVDNQIFELMQKLLPSPNMIDWDIEAIGSIRETIREQLVKKKKIINEKQFYPYLKT